MRRFLLSPAAALIFASVLACERRVWTGPLATAAESVFASTPTVGCDLTTADLGFEGFRLPLRTCHLVRGDTTFTVVSDNRRALLVVTRMQVDSSRQAAVHDSIQFAIGTDYGAPIICPDSADVAESEVRRWNTLDRQVVLRNYMTNEVWLEKRIDHQACPEG